MDRARKTGTDHGFETAKPWSVPNYYTVNLRKVDSTVGQSNASNAFSLPPAALAIDLSKSGYFTNAGANSERLNMRNVADYLKVHEPSCQMRTERSTHEKLGTDHGFETVVCPLLLVPGQSSAACCACHCCQRQASRHIASRSRVARQPSRLAASAGSE